MKKTGSVGILNVGAGDTKLTFDPSNPKETARAAKIVKDMIRRGYSLLVQVGTDDAGEALYRRAKDFDEKTTEYIIADLDNEAAEIMREDRNDATGAAREGRGGKKKSASGGKPTLRRVPANETRAVAVSHSAGG